MTACVILHNMIIEDERDLDLEFYYDNVGSCAKPVGDANEITTFLHTTSSKKILLSISGNSMGDILLF